MDTRKDLREFLATRRARITPQQAGLPTYGGHRRAEAGRSPDDRELTELIGELTTRSQQFSTLWATHNVRWHTTGTKRYHHRVVGDLTLAYEAMALAADPGQTLITFTAEPGSPSQQALAFLASWAASSTQPAAHDRANEDHPA